MENENNKNLSYLVPIGGAIGLLCFSTPWIGCSGQEASGYDLTKEKGEIWLVLVGAILILGSYFLHNYNSKSEEDTKPFKIVIILSAIVSASIMLYYYIKMKSGSRGDYIEVKFGAVLSLLGFIGSIIFSIGFSIIFNTSFIGTPSLSLAFLASLNLLLRILFILLPLKFH